MWNVKYILQSFPNNLTKGIVSDSDHIFLKHWSEDIYKKG